MRIAGELMEEVGVLPRRSDAVRREVKAMACAGAELCGAEGNFKRMLVDSSTPVGG